MILEWSEGFCIRKFSVKLNLIRCRTHRLIIPKVLSIKAKSLSCLANYNIKFVISLYLRNSKLQYFFLTSNHWNLISWWREICVIYRGHIWQKRNRSIFHQRHHLPGISKVLIKLVLEENKCSLCDVSVLGECDAVCMELLLSGVNPGMTSFPLSNINLLKNVYYKSISSQHFPSQPLLFHLSLSLSLSLRS